MSQSTSSPRIINAIRLGKKPTNDDGKQIRPRPLKITFSDIQIKRDVLTSSKNLRQSQNPINKNLYINPDLTLEQRRKDQELRNEMWKIRETQGKNVVIQKGKIVEVPHNVNKTSPARQNPTSATNNGKVKANSNVTASSEPVIVNEKTVAIPVVGES